MLLLIFVVVDQLKITCNSSISVFPSFNKPVTKYLYAHAHLGRVLKAIQRQTVGNTYVSEAQGSKSKWDKERDSKRVLNKQKNPSRELNINLNNRKTKINKRKRFMHALKHDIGEWAWTSDKILWEAPTNQQIYNWNIFIFFCSFALSNQKLIFLLQRWFQCESLILLLF